MTKWRWHVTYEGCVWSTWLLGVIYDRVRWEDKENEVPGEYQGITIYVGPLAWVVHRERDGEANPCQT